MSLHPEDQEIEHLSEKFDLCLRKFHRASNQMDLLDQRIKDTKIRHNRAIKNRKRAFCYTLRQRLGVLFSVKMMYYEYASKMADELDKTRDNMQRHLSAQRSGEISDADADGNSESEETADGGMHL